MHALRTLLEDAKHQLGYSASYDQTGAVRHVIPKAAASVQTTSLRELTLPPFMAASQGLHQVQTPFGTEAGKKTTFSEALLKASRVAQAGAKIIMVQQAAEAVGDLEGELAFKRRAARFDVIEAAKFALVPDADPLAVPPLTGEVSTSALPIYSAAIDVDTMPSYGFRVSLSRAEQRQYEDGQLADAALVAIAMGVARVADAALLSAVAASTSAAFSLGAAAALGLEFSELRALVGTAGTGAAVSQDGNLRAAGITAELTDQTAATIVGAFNRSAVAVFDDVTLVAERIGMNGDLALTCWVNMQPLLPLPGAFWTVGA
ncbi:hypothetical protein ACRS81_12520 [Stutzerimonas stutzeri]|uniref:hypothetical protein n=1 Tax=Stutzerimonas stutzeri TaxID=316 RepID=UPI003EE1BBF0